MKAYAKVVAALASAFAVATSLTVDGDLSLNDAFAIGSALFGALAVGLIPNTPKES